MARNETVRPYECANCLNVNTPLCEFCNQVTSPSGKLSKPTRYQGANGGKLESKELASLSHRIALRLATGNPVHLSWIIRYNQLVSSDKE